jgi:hypothetical protein
VFVQAYQREAAGAQPVVAFVSLSRQRQGVRDRSLVITSERAPTVVMP